MKIVGYTGALHQSEVLQSPWQVDDACSFPFVETDHISRSKSWLPSIFDACSPFMYLSRTLRSRLLLLVLPILLLLLVLSFIILLCCYLNLTYKFPSHFLLPFLFFYNHFQLAPFVVLLWSICIYCSWCCRKYWRYMCKSYLPWIMLQILESNRCSSKDAFRMGKTLLAIWLLLL